MNYMVKIRVIILSLIYSPAWFVYKIKGKVFRDELLQWIKVLKINHKSEFFCFIWLFKNKPEYRSLLYFRMGGGKKLLKLMYREQNNLHFEVKSDIIGHGLVFQHGYSTIINVEKMGVNCQIWQNVTIGKERPGGKKPIIGNNVRIFTGAVVVGDITIGDNVTIGANAVVNKSVPENCTVVGIPARIVRKNGMRISEKL